MRMKKYILIFMIIIPHIVFGAEKNPSFRLCAVEYLQNKKLQFPAANVICSRLAELSPKYHYFFAREKIAQFFAGKLVDFLFIKTVIDLAADRYGRDFPGCDIPPIVRDDIHKKLVSSAFIVIEQSCKK